MRFTERLKSMMTEAQAVRESLAFHDPSVRESISTPDAERGERLLHLRSGQRWNELVAEAGELIADVRDGKSPDWHLREAMTTSDFPELFGDLLYLQLLGNFRAFPSTISSWMKMHEVRDFRALNLYTIDGGNGILETVAERAPYPEISFTEGKKSIQVLKYGKRFGLSFEMLINDDLNAFSDRARFMAESARNSEEKLGAQQIADINGPHASFFTAGNANIVTGNPALSIGGLQTAYKVLAAMTDSEGMPIAISGVILMVTPNLEVTAMNILNAINLDIRGESGGGTTEQFLTVGNWMRGRVTLIVNHFLPLVSTSETTDNWFLIANPNDGTRPAFHFAHLRGRRNPQLFIKDGNARQLGGGVVDPLEGDFDSDSVDYRLRHIMGAQQGEPKMAVASNGSGS